MGKKIHEPFEAGKAALALCVCASVCVCVFVREDGTYENTFHGKRRHSTDAGEGFDELVVRVQPVQLPHVVSEHPVNII